MPWTVARANRANLGLFSHNLGLFLHDLGLFLHDLGLFLHDLGLFSHNIALFLHKLGLIAQNMENHGLQPNNKAGLESHQKRPILREGFM